MAAFVISRDGRHYGNVKRFEKMHEQGVDLFKNVQPEDDLEGTYKLFGPYEEQQPIKHPQCSYIELCTFENKFYYQRKTSVPYLVMLLEHYFRFEPHW